MATETLDPAGVRKDDYVQINGARLSKKTIPDAWIMCHVVESKALSGGDYRLELQPIDGQSSGPVTDFTLRIDTADTEPAVSSVTFISRILHGENTAAIDDDSHAPIIEHFQYSGGL